MSYQYSLLERFGIELEYMVVDRNSLDVRPLTAKLFERVNGEVVNEIENPVINWSNELVMHVLEFKNGEPTGSLIGLDLEFQKEIQRANNQLYNFGAKLLPGAMHPWMNPDLETVIWPHQNSEIYSTYDKTFGCSGHGWSNLQSMHINISFGNDDEFGKLHAAVRAILPLMPMVSASSPLVEGRWSDLQSQRLGYYLKNQKRFKSIMGECIPEPVWTQADYQEKVLQKMYDEIRPADPEGVLQEEWLNSRGAIPKFTYGCIEIRLADTQESPLVDLSIAMFWQKTLELIISEKLAPMATTKSLNTSMLRGMLDLAILKAEKTPIENLELLKVFGVHKAVTGSGLMEHIFNQLSYSMDEKKYGDVFQKLLTHGSLSTRLRKVLGADPNKEKVRATYNRLADCLERGQFFEA